MTLRTIFFFFLVYVGMSFISLFVGTCSHLHAQTRPEIERKITSTATAHGINPELAIAIAEVESNLNPHAVGTLGEIGVFQLRPEFHPVELGQTDRNIETAIRYLAELKIRCSHYGEAFFVCFNYGTARKLKYPHRFPYFRKVTEKLEARNG